MMENYSTYIAVQIVRVVDECFPIFVACEFFDSKQHKHDFVEKLPVVADDDQLSLPKPGRIACVVVREFESENGQVFVEVNTETLWGISSIEEVTNFVVHSSDLGRV